MATESKREHVHIIEAYTLPNTETKPKRMVLISGHYKDRLTLGWDGLEPLKVEDNELVTIPHLACNYLMKHGFTVVSYGYYKDRVVIGVKEWKRLKPTN